MMKRNVPTICSCLFLFPFDRSSFKETCSLHSLSALFWQQTGINENLASGNSSLVTFHCLLAATAEQAGRQANKKHKGMRSFCVATAHSGFWY